MSAASPMKVVGYLGAALLFAGPASAVTFPLDIEFDDALPGNYATVEITENAGNLDFSINLDTGDPPPPPTTPRWVPVSTSTSSTST